jgi:hypothetical protein
LVIEVLRFRLSTLFVVITVLSVFLALNVRRGPFKMLGHVLDNDFTGTWISGWEYGWPWTYHTQPPEYASDEGHAAFDVIYWDNACWNSAVAMGVAIMVAAVWECTLRFVRRIRNGRINQA